MLRFVLRRILLMIPVLFGLLLLTFVMLQLVPGDPAATLAGENATAEQIAEIRQKFGFDDPVIVQFGRYLSQIAEGDFGISAYSRRPVGDDIVLRLPATIELTLVALAFAAVGGILVGTLAAVWHNSPFDHVVRIVSVAGLAVASFWFAIMLQMLFAMELDWLPLRGRLPTGMPIPPDLTGFYLIDSLVAGQFDTFWSALRHLILPAFTLSLGGFATIARFTRSAIIETMQKEFVTYEQAVGYPKRRIILPYVLRNSLVSPVTQIGLLRPARRGGGRRGIDLRLAGARLVSGRGDLHVRLQGHPRRDAGGRADLCRRQHRRRRGARPDRPARRRADVTPC